MRLAPKQLGNSFSIDDYNAICYLLFLDEWCEEDVVLGTEETEGAFATYSFQDPNDILVYQRGNYSITPQFSSSAHSLRVNITNQIFSNAKYKIRFEYIPTKTVTDSNGTYTVEGSDTPDIIPEDGIDDDTEITNNKTRKTFDKYVYNTKNGYMVDIPTSLQQHTIIINTVKIYVEPHPRPEIDVVNGKSNEVDEIIVKDIDSLRTMIERVPRNGVKHIFRLVNVNNQDYKPTKVIPIYRGQNIEVRGGTNKKTRISGEKMKTCGRIFYVKAGSKLTIKNLHIHNCKCYQKTNSTNTTDGYGGAIFVDYDPDISGRKHSILNVFDCYFHDCQAGNGGAIATKYSRLYVYNTDFINCHSTDTSRGGAIYYNQEAVSGEIIKI